MALQRSAGNGAATVAVRRLQGDSGASPEPAKAALLVADDVVPGPGQLTKQAFLHQLRPALEEAVQAELASTRYTVAGCPWVDHWLTYYSNQPPSHLERAIRLWAPQASQAQAASDYVGAVCFRTRAGMASWKSSGAVPTSPPTDGTSDRTPGASPHVQRSNDSAAAVLALGSGSPLDTGVRYRLGGASDGVRLHTDEAGAKVAQHSGARAVTVGQDIAFAQGAYTPGTSIGDALLAHELAHVAQQGDARSRSTSGPSNDELEHDADLGAAYTLIRLRHGDTSALAERAAPRLHSGLRISRCSQPAPMHDPRPEYDDSVDNLRVLYARKQAVVDGTEPATALPEINAGIELQHARLRDLGIRLSADQVYDAVTAAEPVDMLAVRGRVERTPAGEAFLGQRLHLHATLDYLPAGRTIRYEWRWRTGVSREFQFLAAPGSTTSPDLELGEPFWNLIDDDVRRNRQLEVLTRVYLGEENTPTATLSTGSIALADHVPAALSLNVDPPALIQGGRTTVRPAEWVPPHATYSIDWDVDGAPAERDVPVLSRTFDRAGDHRVTARLYQVTRSFGIHDPRLLQELTTTVRVEDPVAASERVLDAATTDQLPGLGTVTTSIEDSIVEMERRAARGGEQAEYWRDRIEGQRNRLARLREQAPNAGRMQPLPTVESALDPSEFYSATVPAALVLPSGGGAQPLQVHVTFRRAGEVWQARLIDSTGADVVHFDGQAATASGAQRAALQSWQADHPYPRGGRVAYRAAGFAPAGAFETTTASNTAKAWVDGILTIGGVVVAGLLLLVPEPTSATKWLGAIILAASVGRSAVAIYENINIGIPPTDSRNVLEGLSIVTAMVGASGTALRQLGISAVRPAVYRAGNYLVMMSLAGDVGTLAFVTESGLAQIRAAQNDPTLDEGQRSMAVLRVISTVMLNGAMFFVSNRDLMKQGVRRSDFFRTDPDAVVRGAPRGEVHLEPGARLDIAAELRAAGEPLVRGRIGAMNDRNLIDRHGTLPWMRQELSPPQIRDLLLHLETDSLVALQDVGAARAHAALEKLGDYGANNILAPALRGAGLVSLAAGKITTGSRIVLCPDNHALVRINGELDIHPRRLAEIPESDRNALMRVYLALEKSRKSKTAKMTSEDEKLLKRLTGSRVGIGYRLRSEYHRAQADQFLHRLGIMALPAEKRMIFERMTNAERDRLYDLVHEDPPNSASDLPRQAAAYALPRSNSVRQFVEHYFIYTYHFYNRARPRILAYEDRVAAEIELETTRIAAAGVDPTSKQVEQITGRAHKHARAILGIPGAQNARDFYYNEVMHEMAARGPSGNADTERPSVTAMAEVESGYSRHVADLRGRFGGAHVPPGLSKTQLVNRLQELPDITFASESATVYHTAKHYPKLPFSVRSAAEAAGLSDIDTYLRSAHDTIANMSIDNPAGMVFTSQDGTFRSVRFTHNGRISIVHVRDDGHAVLATHMRGG